VMNWSGKLRDAIRESHVLWAAEQGIPYYLSRGRSPTVLFEVAADGSGHGNFLPESWRAIAANPVWGTRTRKSHSQPGALPEEKRSSVRELDSSNSSDALLMNCFCYPGAAARILKGLGLPADDSAPEFGFKARLSLLDGSEDATEIDMRLGSVLFEAKLTEHDFTTRPRPHVERYRNVEIHLDLESLPTRGAELAGYQLVRNILAAVHYDAKLIVLLDQRRPDLMLEWWRVHAAIRSVELRSRCEFRTWQQVAAASPVPLAQFLAKKYWL
jgi:hypothetical protein